MEIYDSNHVRPTALHVLDFEHQLIYPLLRIPVYVINALYLWPITVWTYLKYGRPVVPRPGQNAPPHCAHSPLYASAGGETERVRSIYSEKIYYNTGDSEEGRPEPAKSDPHDSYVSEGYNEGYHNEGGHRLAAAKDQCLLPSLLPSATAAQVASLET